MSSPDLLSGSIRLHIVYQGLGVEFGLGGHGSLSTDWVYPRPDNVRSDFCPYF